MATILKHTPGKKSDRLISSAERLLDELKSYDIDELRKNAGKLAREVRSHADDARDETGKSAKRAGSTARKAASKARDRAPSRDDVHKAWLVSAEKVIAGATFAAPFVATAAKSMARKRSARRVAMIAPKAAVRSNPVLLTTGLIGTSVVAVLVWRRGRSSRMVEGHEHSTTDRSTSAHHNGAS